MKQKIVILNVVLGLAAVYAAFQLRGVWLAKKSREVAHLPGPPVKAAPVLPYTPQPPGDPVLAAGYNPIAQKFLLDPSRNPNVPLPEPAPAPPPPPMPPLPKYHGQMNLGGISAILSEAGSSAQTAVKPGETIGQFKLVDVSTQEIVFEWNGELVRKRLDELAEKSGAAQQAPVASAANQPPPPPPPPVIKTPQGPGEITPQGFKVCNPNDSTADGTVQDGFRKVSYATPFGSACRWDPIGK